MTEGRIFLTATATTATDLKFACLFRCVFPKNVVSLRLETGSTGAVWWIGGCFQGNFLS